jgi:monoterpene epsilon-lactone hydrolase
VNAFIVTPDKIAPGNERRLLMHVHGGGYVFGPGESALPEAMLLASFGGYKVVSVDYRMPPDYPYPAAMDDAMAVWKELLKTNRAREHGGVRHLDRRRDDAGAGAARQGRERAAARRPSRPGTPWSDIAKIGDTYQTNEWVDNILVTWDGWLGRAALLYAAAAT